MRLSGLAVGAVVLFLVVGLLSHSERIDTISKADFDAKFFQRIGNSFPERTYYIGSSSGYDYFIIQNGMNNSDSHYRVPKTENAVTDRFALTEDEKLWQHYGIILARAMHCAYGAGYADQKADEQEIRENAITYRDAYLSGYSVAGPETVARNLANGTIQSVETLSYGWHVTFVTTTNQHQYFLHVYVKSSGGLDRIERGPDK